VSPATGLAGTWNVASAIEQAKHVAGDKLVGRRQHAGQAERGLRTGRARDGITLREAQGRCHGYGAWLAGLGAPRSKNYRERQI
jgi:hypothetical protein